MDTKKEAKKYLSKYFKAQYINETDIEYKSLVDLLNKALRIHDVIKSVCPRCGGQLINTKEYGWFCPDVDCRIKGQADL